MFHWLPQMMLNLYLSKKCVLWQHCCQAIGPGVLTSTLLDDTSCFVMTPLCLTSPLQFDLVVYNHLGSLSLIASF